MIEIDGDEYITVAELLAILQALPPDLPVYTEGCDCAGPCKGASVFGDDSPGVLLERGGG